MVSAVVAAAGIAPPGNGRSLQGYVRSEPISLALQMMEDGMRALFRN